MEKLKIRIVKVIPARRWQVIRLLTHLEQFSRYMPNIKKCEVVEKSRTSAVTSWKAEIDQIPISWTEKDEFDFRNFKVSFRAIDGDLECFEGCWTLLEHSPTHTEVTVEVEARIGVPMVEEVIGPILKKKIEKNFQLMLEAIQNVLSMRRYRNIRDRRVSSISGFSVIGHPYNLDHLIRYLRFYKPDLKLPSREFLTKLFELAPSYRSYDIPGFRSQTGKSTNGYFVMCPIIPEMLVMSPDRVIEKVAQACKVSEELGVGVVALGGFTSIAGEQYGKALLQATHVPLTTGNTLTVAMVLQGIRRAAKRMDVTMSEAHVTVIGGTGDIGGACARILSGEVAKLTITSRSEKNLMEAERVLSYGGRAVVNTSTDNNVAVRGADIIIAAASSSGVIVDFKNFKPGAIVCDVGYPKNISHSACNRSDILIFSGGIVSLPSDIDLGFDIGLPSTRVLYGCFAEAIVLDLEERYENFSWGRGNITKEKVELIEMIAAKNGFELAPFFWGIRRLEDRDIEAIVRAASTHPAA